MARIISIENPDLPSSTGRSQGVATTGAKKKAKSRKTAEQPKTGRPLFQIDWGQVEKLANIFTPIPDIAYIIGCSVDTLERQCKKIYDTTFAVWWKSKAARGKMTIRKTLFSEAVGYENQGYLREADGNIARYPDGEPIEDKRRDRKPNTMVLMYLAKHVLDFEQLGYGYDPEHNEDAEDERESTSTVYPITFVGDPNDIVEETPAPGEDAIAGDDEEAPHLDATGLSVYDPTNQPNYGDDADDQ